MFRIFISYINARLTNLANTLFLIAQHPPFERPALAPYRCLLLGEGAAIGGRDLTHSMTAYATQIGADQFHSWEWEMRGVNARGLDVRIRFPEGLGALDASLRAQIKSRLTRGAISVSLRQSKSAVTEGLAIDPTQLDAVLAGLDKIQDRAMQMGITLAQPTSADVLAQRGVWPTGGVDAGDETDAMITALEADFGGLLDKFIEMRAAEGAALETIIAGQLQTIEGLTAQAKSVAQDAQAGAPDALAQALSRITNAASDIDPDRIAQELALLTVKADVTEELDRLLAHIDAARALLTTPGPKGRKLDFLSQEFNREANTLCSKSNSTALTNIGVELKVVIDQMREQIQNVE